MENNNNGFALKVKTKRKTTFNIFRGTKNLNQLIDLPKKDEVYKLISFAGGFASINFVLVVAENEDIEELTLTTLRVGAKQLKILNNLYQNNKLNKATFIVGTIMKENKKRYTYYDDLEKISENNNWEVKVVNNHSKIVLIKTKENYYVLETSSNFNDNPKIEQYSFENNEELYNFYCNILKEI